MYFIPTKFHQNPSSGSGEEVANEKSLQTDDGRRRADGRWTVRYDNSSPEPSGIFIVQGKREVPRDVRNSKVRRQDKFRRDWSRH